MGGESNSKLEKLSAQLRVVPRASLSMAIVDTNRKTAADASCGHSTSLLADPGMRCNQESSSRFVI
jgi:hypothetical protein